jgi:hypothetical protein
MNTDYSSETNQQQYSHHHHHHHHNQAKIVLDYSFCNSSNLWNYFGIATIILFISTLISYLRYRQRQKDARHHHDRYNWIYISVLIVLGLAFVTPFMCWLLTIVEIFITFLRYGQIAASPLPILSLPIRWFAIGYMKMLSGIHWYLTSSGTFIFLLFFLALKYFTFVFVITLRFGLPGFFFCAWLGFAMPLYAMIEVGNVDCWIDLAFNCQLPLLILLKFSSLIIDVQRPVLFLFVFSLFLLGYFLKFGLTLLFVCKCLLIVALVRFTYVIGKAFVVLVLFTPLTTNPNRDTGHDE